MFFKADKDLVYRLSPKEMFSYGLPLMISGCAYMLFQATDKLVIGRYCSESDLGIYSSAASFLSLFVILQGSFTTVWWPTVMRNYVILKINHYISKQMIFYALLWLWLV